MKPSSGVTGHVTDGPFLWRREDGTLLCLWSGFSERGYTQGVAVSDNGDIDGRFIQAEPLFRENGGHGMLFRTPDGRTLLALHQPNSGPALQKSVYKSCFCKTVCPRQNNGL